MGHPQMKLADCTRLHSSESVWKERPIAESSVPQLPPMISKPGRLRAFSGSVMGSPFGQTVQGLFWALTSKGAMRRTPQARMLSLFAIVFFASSFTEETIVDYNRSKNANRMCYRKSESEILPMFKFKVILGEKENHSFYK
jgi:hypothetical protein